MRRAIWTRFIELGHVVRKAGPYVALEVVLPGGTLFALLLYLHRSGRLADLGAATERALDQAANGTFDQMAYALGSVAAGPRPVARARERDGLEPLDLTAARRLAA